MGGVAVVRVEGDELVVWPAPVGPVADGLTGLGLAAGPEPGTYTGPWQALEPVCSLLDRCGYRWAADTAHAPRMWAERLFAETPGRLHDDLYRALAAVLAGDGGDDDHAAVLRWAWLTRPRWGSGERLGDPDRVVDGDRTEPVEDR